MNRIEVRVPAGLSKVLLAEIRRPSVREPVVFAYVSHARLHGRRLILVRDIVVPPEEAFLPSLGHGARWSGAYTIELLNQCADRQCGLLLFHHHGHRGQVRLSEDDLASAGELLPRFQLVYPDRPHGSIVIGPESVAGIVMMPEADDAVPVDRLRLLGETINDFPPPDASDEETLLFARQPLAVGDVATKIMREAAIAVIGLSGGGSQVVPHLARAGVGNIIGVDPQRVEASNLYASPWVTRFDALLRVRKTTAARLRIWLTNRHARFHGLSCGIAEPQAVAAIKEADVIIGCVNNLHARADIMEIASRYCIPYVDIGMRLSSNDSQENPIPRMTGLPGNVFVVVPGGPCMWCTGFLTSAKLDRETGGRGRGYLERLDERDAFVSAFNGILAGQAAAEAFQLLLGYAHESERAPYRRYDGLEGTLLECTVQQDPTCRHCRETLAAGDPIWQ